MKLVIILALLVAVVAVCAKRPGTRRNSLSTRVGRILAISYGGIVGLIIGYVVGEALAYGGANDRASSAAVIVSVVIVALGWYVIQLRREPEGR